MLCIHGVSQQLVDEDSLTGEWALATRDGMRRSGCAEAHLPGTGEPIRVRGEPRGRRRSVIAVKGSRLYLLARTAGPLKPGGIEAGPGAHVVVDVDGAADAAGGCAESVFGRTPTATSTRSTSLVRTLSSFLASAHSRLPRWRGAGDGGDGGADEELDAAAVELGRSPMTCPSELLLSVGLFGWRLR